MSHCQKIVSGNKENLDPANPKMHEQISLTWPAATPLMQGVLPFIKPLLTPVWL